MNTTFSYLVMPFKIPNINSSSNLSELIANIYNNKIIVTLNLGNPPSKIDFYLNMNEYYYYIKEGSCNGNLNSFYNYSNSNTSQIIHSASIINNKTYGFLYDSITFYEDIQLKKTKEAKNLYFLLDEDSDKSKINNLCGSLGFNLKNRNNGLYNIENFIITLKQFAISNSYSWYIHFFNQKYNNEYDGAIVISIYDKIFLDDFSLINNNMTSFAYDITNILSWVIYVDKIYYEFNNTKTENKDYVRVGFTMEIDGIIVPETIYYKMRNDFFKKFMELNICKDGAEQYKYIYCDKEEFSKYDYQKDFPKLTFTSNNLNKTLELNGYDLFREYGDKIILMVVAKTWFYNIWTMGKIFLKKYHLFFDNDKKIIGIFEEIEKKEEKSESGFGKFLNFLDKIKFYVLIVLAVIIGIIIGTKIAVKNRKKRANELDDAYEYMENEKKESIIGIDSEPNEEKNS